MQTNLMIYGSCVSRDAFPLLGSDFKLLSYVARQSMISAISKPTMLLEGADLASAFQNRSLAGDIRSNMLQLLRRHSSEIDVLVIDLTDERLGVIQLPDGSYVTRSQELASSERLGGVQGRIRYIDVLTERHWTLWENAATRLLNAVTALGLRERTIVLNTPWAELTDTGGPIPDFRGLDTAEVNGYLGECCAHIRSLGYKVLDMPQELAYSSNQHRWGAAPYHLCEPARQWIAAQIRDAAEAPAAS
ncbi:DUF6270 domain-containing protein [Arthrobacter sp. RHLT1-20]